MLVVCTQVVLWMLCVIVIGDICIVFGVLRVGVVLAVYVLLPILLTNVMMHVF